jgi:hypothetical protein
MSGAAVTSDLGQSDRQIIVYSTECLTPARLPQRGAQTAEHIIHMAQSSLGEVGEIRLDLVEPLMVAIWRSAAERMHQFIAGRRQQEIETEPTDQSGGAGKDGDAFARGIDQAHGSLIHP